MQYQISQFIRKGRQKNIIYTLAISQDSSSTVVSSCKENVGGQYFSVRLYRLYRHSYNLSFPPSPTFVPITANSHLTVSPCSATAPRHPFPLEPSLLMHSPVPIIICFIFILYFASYSNHGLPSPQSSVPSFFFLICRYQQFTSPFRPIPLVHFSHRFSSLFPRSSPSTTLSLSM